MQHLGPLIIITTAVFSTLLVKRRHNGDTSLTISKHVALEGHNPLFFGAYEVLIALGFFWFIANWFTPSLGLPDAYSVVAGIGLFGLAIAGAAPDKPGRSGTIHSIGAYGMALGMYIMILGVAVYATVPWWLTGITWLTFGYITVNLALMIKKPQRYLSRMLYYQALYFGLFYLVIILATYFHS